MKNKLTGEELAVKLIERGEKVSKIPALYWLGDDTLP